MKTSKILSVAALSLMAVAGIARADDLSKDEGVLMFNSTASRAAVQSQGAGAAHQNLWAEGASAGVVASVSQQDRATVKTTAVAAAHDSTQNLNRSAFVNSTIPAAFHNGSLARRTASAL
jgi:hypothetical protein